MSKVWKSNKPYTGLIKLQNTVDFISTDAEKIKFVRSALVLESVDLSTTTDATLVNVFNNFIAHRTRVLDDGGFLASTNKTIKAIHFALKNSLSGYVAYSAAFGCKANTLGNPIKFYSLSGAQYDGISLVLDRLTVNGLDVTSNTVNAGSVVSQTALRSKNPIFALSGDILNLNTGNMLASTVNTPLPSGITNYERLHIFGEASLAINVMYRSAADTPITRPLIGSLDPSKKGVVAFLDTTNIKVYSEILTNGQGSYSYTDARKDMSLVDTYFNVSLLTANELLREAWFISNGNADVAQKLSLSISY